MCDSQPPLCALSGTVSKLQQFQDLPWPVTKGIHIQKSGISRVSLLRCAKICVWSHISHHGKITKTKNGVNREFKDFLNGRGHCTEIINSNPGIEMCGKHQKNQQNLG